MRSLERHRDVGAYALGVLDEAEAFRFEDHLMECPQCAAHVTEFGPTARQLLLYRRATPRFVHPMAQPGPRMLDGLLAAVATRRRAVRRRLLYGLAASVVFAVAGPAVAVYAGHAGGSGGSGTQVMAATDPQSGVWARVTSENLDSGSRIRLEIKDGSQTRSCRLVAVGHDGSEQVVTNWTAPGDGTRMSTIEGGSTMHPAEIDRYDVRTADGQHVVTLDAP
ncbi:zf-HC2 domain-containing protein [Streptomyces sp. NPDC004542]|uniref:zf-HC2 domain-containing protein n=1 Tax=Streptomyces sp. NPDC004542 TaxID=3154281 RepID=UPI0033AE893B